MEEKKKYFAEGLSNGEEICYNRYDHISLEVLAWIIKKDGRCL